MKGDLTVSEQRLLAALKRIDVAIDRAVAQPRDGEDGGDGEGAGVGDRELAAAHAQLVRAGQDIAQLAAANEALTAANRLLLDRLEAGGDGVVGEADEVRLALEAELSALRAARAAEERQIAGILDRLDRVMGPLDLVQDGVGQPFFPQQPDEDPGNGPTTGEERG